MNDISFNFLKSSNIKITLLVFFLLALSGCKAWEMASYRWHSALAKPGWSNVKMQSSIPFSMINGHILVKVNVNDSAPLTFVLDSGAEATVITQTAATMLLNLPKNKPITISGAGDKGDPIAYVVNDIRIDVGDFYIKNMPIIYAPTEAMPFASVAETYFDGVLGADFFNCCLVEINHDHNTLLILKPSAYNAKKYATTDWQKLAIEVQDNTPYLTTEIHDGSAKKTVKVMLDTGATGALSLFAGNNDFAIPAKTYLASTVGISGTTSNYVGILPTLYFGDHRFTQLPTYFRTVGSNSQRNSHGVLGNQVMQKFNLVFNFQDQKIWIQPNKNNAVPILLDHSGLSLWPHPKGAIVKEIAQDTGASALNISLGSIVTSINNTQITHTNFDRLKGLFSSTARSSLPLCWQDAGMSYCDSLTLASRLK
ncbi:aspartyl protease family protein [Paraglaciecola polaris]|uniref:aspartyl protease family protein n=2 Tax=Paraglaciecola polaris TaxID=222814 RepID=UPI0030EE550C|tara:strand:- start:562 stop:1836 length:1275 start_codon:yes stop_codon:yes gene_type:complete